MESKISIIIPTMNEEKTIASVINGLTALGNREVIVVDTDSRDKTREISKSLGATVVEEPRRGYGRAYKTGLEKVSGDIIVCLDGDGTYPTDIIQPFIDILQKENLDFISCDRMTLRNEHNYTTLHFIGNSVLNITLRVLFHLTVRDSQSGMWIFRSTLIDKMKIISDGMAFSEEIKIEAAKHGTFIEIPIRYGIRITKPKLNTWRDGISNLLHLFKKRINS
ncbi:MAG: glycosyltransferase family 2 protein [Candidatus Thermoplasmatota archaeon]|nr:glycosyltransferase family 2 protein [Candidatus Thermoplasmatota archaeon]